MASNLMLKSTAPHHGHPGGMGDGGGRQAGQQQQSGPMNYLRRAGWFLANPTLIAYLSILGELLVSMPKLVIAWCRSSVPSRVRRAGDRIEALLPQLNHHGAHCFRVLAAAMSLHDHASELHRAFVVDIVNFHCACRV
jgi:hypothetical protein